MRCVIAKSFARIHRQNLINYGAPPLLFSTDDDYERLEPDDRLALDTRAEAVESAEEISARLVGSDATMTLIHDLDARDLAIVRAGALVNLANAE